MLPPGVDAKLKDTPDWLSSSIDGIETLEFEFVGPKDCSSSSLSVVDSSSSSSSPSNMFIPGLVPSEDGDPTSERFHSATRSSPDMRFVAERNGL